MEYVCLLLFTYVPTLSKGENSTLINFFFAHFKSMLTMYFLIDILQKGNPFISYIVYYVHKHVFNFFEKQLAVA